MWEPQDRYHALLRIVRKWRHVRLLKRMGRGHSTSGVKGTKEGECAVLCPACPIPGVNLPSGWKEHLLSKQYDLYINPTYYSINQSIIDGFILCLSVSMPTSV